MLKLEKFNILAIIMFLISILLISGCYTKVGYAPSAEDRLSKEEDTDRWETYTYREYYYPFYFDYYDLYFPYYWYPHRYWYRPWWYYWDDYYYIPEKKPEVRQRDSINNERKSEPLRKQNYDKSREKSSEDNSSSEIKDHEIRIRRSF